VEFDPTDPKGSIPVLITQYEGPRPGEDQIRKWQEWNIDKVREALEAEGSAPPGLLFLAPDPSDLEGFLEGFLDLRAFYLNDEGLAKMEIMVPEILRQSNAFASFVVREAWTAEVEGDNPVPNEDVKDVPGAIEVVSCLCESQTTSQMRLFPIERDGDKAALGKELEGGDSLRGSGVTFLHQPKPGEVAN